MAGTGQDGPRAGTDAATVPVDGPPAGGRELVILGAGIDLTRPLPEQGSLTIGRAPDCDVCVDDPSVSRRHLRLHLGEPMRCEDLGASNRTRVRGRPLEPHQPVDLGVGEVIELGKLLLLVRAGAAAPAGEPAAASAPQAPTSAAGPVVVADSTMRRIYQLVERIAAGDVPVLILGETGVGKEMVAEALHRFSPRAAGPFIRINCAALPPSLLQGELFGHERGAFTGAERRQPGLIESADGGTLFLDEIGDAPGELQTALLRVLEDRAVLPIGARQPLPVDVRFVAATNHDLRDPASGFRRDLYHRLNGISFTVPPLRDRPDEIEPLAQRFAGRTGAAGFTGAALAQLRAYRWPGNVRELRMAVESARLLAGDRPIAPEHLPAAIAATAAGEPTTPAPPDDGAAAPPLRAQMSALERERIVDALQRTGGNQSEAARLLGMSRRTLVKRIRDYGIPRGRRVPER